MSTSESQVAIPSADAEILTALLRERDQLLMLHEAVADVVQAVNASLRLDDVLPLIARHAVALLRAEGAAVSLLREGELEVVAATGVAAPLIGSRIPLYGSMSGRSFREQSAIVSNEATAGAEMYGPGLTVASITKGVIAPLASGNAALGVLAVMNRAADFTSDDALTLQRLGDQVAVAVANARLYEDAEALAERYRRVVETTSDAILMLDGERRIVFANHAAETLFGTIGTLVGLPVAAFIPAESQERIADLDARTLAGSSQRYDATLVRADGERRQVSVGTSPLREAGAVTGIVASLRDVTDERRAREAVTQSESRYRNLFETASDAIYTLDAHGSFTSVNEATCRMAGRRPEDLLGRNPLSFLDPADIQRVKEQFKSAVAGASRRFECRFLRPDGGERLLSVTNTPIRHAGVVIGVLGIARDVTDEREQAHALNRSEARYTRLVETASDGILTVDANGLLTSVNRAMERATGRPRAELLGQPFVAALDARDQALATRMLADSIAGMRKRGDFRYPSATGETRTCSLTFTPLVEGDAVTGALGVARDVTDEQRLSEQLMQQEKLAAVGQLVSGVAHELNNPLASVLAFAQLLLANPVPYPPDQRRAIETIDQEARRAAKIVSNLLTFARQHAPERSAADLNRVVTDSIELRRYALRTAGVEVELELDPLLPTTWADPFQLQQVVLNLLGNAEHALSGRATLRRVVVTTAARDGRLVLSVADNGPGITPENLRKIFNPFFTTKPVGEGTGLGLSISDGIIREHGGRIRAESPPGGGATFVIELPYTPPPNGPVPVVVSGASTPSVRRRILVVDDEASLRTAIASYFRSLGHAVETTGTGRDAIIRAAGNSFDAVLLDLRLPDLTGDAVLAELRRVAPSLADRVVFVTGDTQSESTRHMLAASGRPVVSKPFLFDDLGTIVLEVAGAEE